MAHRARTIKARLKSKGRFWMFLPASFASKKGQNIRPTEKITIRLIPRMSLGIVFISWYGARKYHGGRMDSGVIRGFAGKLVSGGRKIFCINVIMKKTITK